VMQCVFSSAFFRMVMVMFLVVAADSSSDADGASSSVYITGYKSNVSVARDER
jgi:hypothetical protein